MLDRPLPLDQIDPNFDFLGQDGPNRQSERAPFPNDLVAIKSFLNEYSSSPDTHRTFQREAERLLNWSLIVKGKSLSALNRQDIDDYLLFLAKPEPFDFWCGPRARRDGDAWKPFVKGLNESSMVTAVASIGSMFNYFVEAEYLYGNPLGIAKQIKKKIHQAFITANPEMANSPSAGVHGILSFAESTQDNKVERFLDEKEWLAYTQTIEEMPRETPFQRDEYHRARFISAFLMMLAPRASEIVGGRMCGFKKVRSKWNWSVLGKGNKAALLPVPPDMLSELRVYRRHFGLSELPGPSDTTPLVFSLKRNSADQFAPITQRRLHQILKDLFIQTAIKVEPFDAASAEKLRSASTHWGRHTGITGKVKAGISQRLVTKLARHGDSRTTLLYIHDEEDLLHEEAAKQTLPWAAGLQGSEAGETQTAAPLPHTSDKQLPSIE